MFEIEYVEQIWAKWLCQAGLNLQQEIVMYDMQCPVTNKIYIHGKVLRE